MTHVSAAWSQSAFRLRNDDGSQTAATWIAATNTNATIEVGTNFRARFAILETAGGAGNVTNAHLQYNLAGAGWLEVTTTSPIQFATSAFVADGTATTQQITTGTFVAGSFDDNGTVAVVSYAGNDRSEFEYSIRIDGAQVSDGQTFQLRVVDGTTPFTTYAQTPTVTISKPAFAQTITGAAYSDPDTIGAGAIVVPARLENTAFRAFADDVVGAITAQTPIAAVNTNWSQALDVTFHVAMVASETNGGTAASVPLAVQYRINGGAWTDLTPTSPIRSTPAVNCTTVDNTNYGTVSLATGGTVQRAQYDNSGGASGTETLSNSSFEYTTCLLINSAQVTEGDTIQLRLTNNGTAFDADTVIPTITVAAAPAAPATLLTQGSSSTNTTTFNTASVTITAGKAAMVVVWAGSVNANENTANPTVTGAGQTWTLKDGFIPANTYDGGGGNYSQYQRVSTFVTDAASGGSGALTITFSTSQDITSWAVFEIEEGATFGTIDGPTATTANATTVSEPLAGSGQHVAIGLWANYTTGSVPDLTPQAGWTEFAQTHGGEAGFGETLHLQYSPATGNTTASFTASISGALAIFAYPIEAGSGITLVDSDVQTGSGSPLTLTLTIGTNYQADDFAVIHHTQNDNVSTLTAPAGWTQLTQFNDLTGTDRTDAIYYKVLTASETDPVVTSNRSDLKQSASLMIWRGVDTTTPFDVTFSDALHRAVGLSDNPTNQPITTVSDGALVILLHNFSGSGHTVLGAPSGYTLGPGQISSTSAEGGMASAYKIAATAGTETPGAWTHTATGGNSFTTHTLALAPAGAGGSGQTITGADHADPDTLGSGTVTPGAVTLGGTAHVDPDTFGAGALEQIGPLQVITGSSFVNTAVVGTGSVTPGPVTITGPPLADGDTIGSGSVAPGAVTITGTAFADPDTTGSGSIGIAPVDLSGAAHADGDTFGAGTLSAGPVAITGAAFADADSFGTGALQAGAVGIAGQAHADPDTIGAGSITQGGVTLEGAAHGDPDTFGQGSLATGAVTISGATHGDSDTLGEGTVSAGGALIGGAAYPDPDAFGSGILTRGIVGAELLDADAFGSGSLTTGAVTIAGATFADPDTLGHGTISTGGAIIEGSTLADGDTIGSGALQTGPVTITGARHQDGDSFGAGITSAGGTLIAGARHVDPDSFGAGSLTTGATGITGAAHEDADAFGTGLVSAGNTILEGARHIDGDSFGQGTVAVGAATLAGSRHSDGDAFGVGTIATGPVGITGAAHGDGDAFGAGIVQSGAYLIAGAAHSDGDTFGSGALDASATIGGSLHGDADGIGSGVLTTGSVPISGTIHAGDADTFGAGSLAVGTPGTRARNLQTQRDGIPSFVSNKRPIGFATYPRGSDTFRSGD